MNCDSAWGLNWNAFDVNEKGVVLRFFSEFLWIMLLGGQVHRGQFEHKNMTR